ncbi:TraB/GumN family protein [bacterium]|nr:TraB/GumN family protein [bacterium]
MEQAGAADGGPSPGEESDVHRLTVDGRELILVGTAHVSKESAELVERVIERERPDCVCVELDARRYDALAHRTRIESLDLKTVIRNRQLVPLLLNLLLMSYQKQLGGQLGVVPGSELLAAAQLAERLDIPVRLCDRDVRVTLRRAWAALSLWRKAELIATLLTAMLEAPELDEAELRRLRQQDVLSRLMEELGAAFPGIKGVLIDERDAYLATRLREAPGARIVAVVGAGHVRGMLDALRAGRVADVAALETMPPPSAAARIAGWSIPVVIVAGLAAIGLRHGLSAVGDNALYWVLATGLPGLVGAAIALGHPLTLLATFLSAPITTLSPLLGVGYVAALVQAYVRPPLVREIQSVADDVRVARRWWTNRLLRICLVFLLSTIGTSMGTIVGTTEILSNLFH